MKSINAFVMLLILGICTISIATAEENATPTTTATPTESATGTPAATQTVTQVTVVATTIQPATVVSTVQSTTTVPTVQPTVVEKEKKFRVGPTVRIRPLNDEISKNQDGLIELYMDNPGLNDLPLSVDARISVPSGIHVYGQGFGEASAAGMVYGKFDIPPGAARTINIVIKAEKIGDFNAQFSGMYWPGDNKDAFQPISLTHPFKVSAPSADPLKDTSEKSGESGGDGGDKSGKTSEKSPGMTIVMAIVAIAMLVYITKRR